MRRPRLIVAPAGSDRFQLCLTRRPGTSPGLLSSLLPVLLGTSRELVGGLVRRLGTLLARLAQRLRGLLTGLAHGLHGLLTRLRSSAVAITERPYGFLIPAVGEEHQILVSQKYLLASSLRFIGHTSSVGSLCICRTSLS
jgi:hypothetical protein